MRAMMKVRNNWAHCAGSIPDKDVVVRDLEVILNFFESVIITNVYTDDILEFKREMENTDFSSVLETTIPRTVSTPITTIETSGEIKEKDRVYLAGDPNSK